MREDQNHVDRRSCCCDSGSSYTKQWSFFYVTVSMISRGEKQAKKRLNGIWPAWFYHCVGIGNVRKVTWYQDVVASIVCRFGFGDNDKVLEISFGGCEEGLNLDAFPW